MKLSEEKVVEVKQLRASGLTFKAIGDAFDCDRTTVSKAARGINWR